MKELTVEKICEYLADEYGINGDYVCDTLTDDDAEADICFEKCDKDCPSKECYMRFFRRVLK